MRWVILGTAAAWVTACATTLFTTSAALTYAVFRGDPGWATTALIVAGIAALGLLVWIRAGRSALSAG